MKKLLILFLLVCSVCSAQYGPIRFPSSGGGTFTGGTLTSDLIFSDTAELELANGSSSNLAFRFKNYTSTGAYAAAGGSLYLMSAAKEIFRSDGSTSTRMQSPGGKWVDCNDAIQFIIISHDFGSYNAGSGKFRPTIAASGTAPHYTWHTDEDSGLARQDSGKPSLVSDGVECIRVASSGTQIFQYTKLGDVAPALKCKLVETVSPNAAASYSTSLHGLTASKIRSFTTTMDCGGGVQMAPEYSFDPTYTYSVFVDTNSVLVLTATSSSGGVHNKTAYTTIWYTE